MPSALLQSSLTSLPLLGRGKVRENYAVGDDRILMIATDRLSAFDVIMGEPMPGKGALLTRMALFWFDKLAGIVPNHLTGDDPLSAVTPAEREQVEGRAMLVKRLKPVPVEAVVRGQRLDRLEQRLDEIEALLRQVLANQQRLLGPDAAPTP